MNLSLTMMRPPKRARPFPTTLFADDALGALYDASDLSSMFQDSAATTLAAVDQPVGRINDLSGRGNHLVQATAGSRPTLRLSSGLYYLEFDGTDDFLSCAYVQSAYSLTIMAAARFTGTSQGGILSVAASDTNYKVISDDGTVSQLMARDRNASILSAFSDATDNGDNVLLGEFTSTQIRARANTATEGTTANSNDFGTSVTLFAGKLRPAGNFMTGRIYAAAVINRVLTAAEETALRTYLGARAGL